MSATRSVERTPAENLVIGAIMSTWGRSCKRPHLVLGQRTLPADVEHRGFRAKGAGDAGHGVGAAWSRRRHHAAELAGLARIAVGGVGGDLLVAHVDDLDAFVDAAVIDVDDVPAAEREDRVDTFVLECARSRWPPEITLSSRLFCFRVSVAVSDIAILPCPGDLVA